MARLRYLTAYDVADDARRRRVFSVLMESGDRIQQSGFICELSQREYIDATRRLTGVVHAKEDQTLFLDLGPAEGSDVADRITSIGTAFTAPERERVRVV